MVAEQYPLTPADRAEILAREWMAELGGRWHRGMIDGHTGHLCTGTYADGTGSFWLGDERSEPVHLVHPNSRWPDLSHPGTRAFLLEDVRKAWGDRFGVSLSLAPGNSRVSVHERDGRQGMPFHSKWTYDANPAAPLVAALRAAPGEEAQRG